MKKLWSAYFSVISAVFAAGLICAGLPAFARNAAFAAAGAFAAWWSAYFIKLAYRRESNALFIRSGIFFVREHSVPLDRITAATRVSLRLSARKRLPLFSVLRTAGARFVIFTDFSTEC